MYTSTLIFALLLLINQIFTIQLILFLQHILFQPQLKQFLHELPKDLHKEYICGCTLF